ncbi:MAG: acyl-CoA dehydrogenase [Pseudomonadota bacterium]
MQMNVPFGLAGDPESLAMLSDTLAAALRDHDEDGAALWSTLSRDIALGGATIAESQGGLGGGAGESWVIMEALGRAVSWTPYLSSVVLGAGPLRIAGGELAEQLLPQVAAGDIRLALAYLEPDRRNAVRPETTIAEKVDGGWRIDGTKVAALGLGDADWLLLSARDTSGGTSLFAIEADRPELTITRYETLDGEGAADLRIDGLVVPDTALVGPAGETQPILERVIDEGIAAICAAACGTMRVLIDSTVDYCKERRQFGQALADFQILQHRLVDMHIAAEQATSLSQLAFAKLDGPADERREAISGAKYLVSEACRTVSQGAVQLHGGIGTTEELVIGRYFKRALMMEHLFGGAAYHLDRYRRARPDDPQS